MPNALTYVAVEELGDRPHVLVDGAARPGSLLTLSHWPQSPTPIVLARDLSAETVFAYLHACRGRLPGRRAARSRAAVRSAIATARRAEAVTNDHFDEDGLVSVFAMTEPVFALDHEKLLVEVASCGDFGVVHSRNAARIAFAIGPIGEQAAAERAESGAAGERPGSWSGPRYQAGLERMIELLEFPERFRGYWEQDDAALAASQSDLRAGLVQIDEVAEVDLAVVTRAGSGRRSSYVAAAGQSSAVPLHQVALHSATSASRVLAFDEGRCELYFRYEGWVRYMSRQVPLRPDLALLAEQLSAAEPSGVRWAADGVGSIVTRMHPQGDGQTGLDPTVISRTVVAYLKTAPSAWDPFRRGGAIIAVKERPDPT